MQNMELIIAGNGAMARLLRERCARENVASGDFIVYGHPTQKKGGLEHFQDIREEIAIAVHFGSGRELPDLIGYCGGRGIPILNGSTGQELPEDCPVPLVHGPNLALPIVALLGVLPKVATALWGLGLKETLIESHQASKRTVPETAKLMAAVIGLLDTEEIKSVRNRAESLALGVPESALDGHGYHWIHWYGDDLEIEVSTKVRGRAPYIDGALFVAREMLRLKERLENRVYTLQEFL